MVQKRVFEAIKNYLEKEYKLDMFSQDVRFAYAVYFAYMETFDDLITMRMILKGAQEHIKDTANFGAFERSVYRTLKKFVPNKEDYLRTVLKIAKEIKL